jgi:hypothetical protein
MAKRIAELFVALCVLAGGFVAATHASAQVVDENPEIEAIVVETGIKDSSDEVRNIVASLLTIAGISAVATLGFAIHTSPRRRARFGKQRPERRTIEKLPMGLDELVPGAPPITQRNPAPIPAVVAATTTVENSNG